MNITAAKYCRLNSSSPNVSVTATINGEELSVPMDTENRHYAAILEWQASPEHYIVLDRTASNGANAGGKVLMENGDNILMDRIEPLEAD